MEKPYQPKQKPNNKQPKPQLAAALRANLKRRKMAAPPKKDTGS